MALSLSFARWDLFLLVLIRVAALFMVAPAFGARVIPLQLKVGLSVFVALLLTPQRQAPEPLFTDLLSMALIAAQEVTVGLLMGFAAFLVFSAVQMSAQFMGVQIGFSFSHTLSPLSIDSAGFLDSFFALLAVVVFLTLGGHHALLYALDRSYEVVPIGGLALSGVLGERLIALSAAALTAAVRLAMPVVATVLLSDAALALVVRTMPQLNVFVVGLPLKIMVGLFALAGLAPMTVAGIDDLTRSAVSAASGILP